MQSEGVMAKACAISVSGTLQRAAATMICLIALQGSLLLSSCHPEFLPAGAAYVHAGR